MAASVGVLQNVRFIWRGPVVEKNVLAELRRRLATVGEVLVNEMKTNVSSSGDKGLNPSKPGQFPHANFGQLRNSLFWDYSAKMGYAVDVGSSVMHGLYMEKGVRGGKVIRPKRASFLTWVGKDGVRRYARQVIQGPIAPRPFISTTIYQQQGRIKAIFGRKMVV